jgi:hypothetical protein
MYRANVPTALAVFACALVGCSSGSHSAFAGDYTPSASTEPDDGGIKFLRDAGLGGPPPADAAGLCPGSTFVSAITDRPNLYFVLDRSGSMLETVDGQEKFTALRIAVVGLVRGLGARANVGAAVFPSTAGGCSAGSEVFATRQGEPAVSATVDSKVTHDFAAASNQPPTTDGGTPTAATLAVLIPTLRSLPGRTVVILATDGGPNCDPFMPCSADLCMPNIEGVPACAGINCCEPPNLDDPSDPRVGPGSCLDSEPTLSAITSLHGSGIPTYVIGLPPASDQAGSAVYDSLLDQMAVAGGTARDATTDDASPDHQYYAVKQIDELDGVLQAISGKVALTCHVALTAPPANRSLINVYLDQNLIDYDPVDGWAWAPDGGIELNGGACNQLEGGNVENVQVVAGCPIHVK